MQRELKRNEKKLGQEKRQQFEEFYRYCTNLDIFLVLFWASTVNVTNQVVTLKPVIHFGLSAICALNECRLLDKQSLSLLLILYTKCIVSIVMINI